MKNLMKMLLVSLTAISFSVANAGDLSITGDAKASYSITSSDGAWQRLGHSLRPSTCVGDLCLRLISADILSNQTHLWSSSSL